VSPFSDSPTLAKGLSDNQKVRSSNFKYDNLSQNLLQMADGHSTSSDDKDLAAALLAPPMAAEVKTKSTPEGIIGKKMKKSKFSKTQKEKRGKKK